ncbi:putative pyridoxal-dependent aspartate 1-decarboxylase [Porticoccaceae bacterium LTM1]|nr:putative pyridoxal-dependent aspartate 1-decarboxylase [Porticoccaceae bacterium LTM1]
MTIESYATASLENLYRIFTVPEAPDSTLGGLDRDISDNLSGFLRDRIVTKEVSLDVIEKDFSTAEIPEQPCFVSGYTDFLLDKLVSRSVHTTAPSFVGHMAVPLPYFMLPLSKILIALNQNLVKIETSKAFTPLERQVLAMLHHLIYQREEGFYGRWIHDADHALGAFCSGGTIANVTALWAARNRLFPPNGDFPGIAKSGLVAALRHSGYENIAVLVSKRGHYSLGKAADLLGIGREQLISIDTDDQNRIDLDKLRQRCENLQSNGVKVMAIVGVAGTTETGSIDPLDQMADIAEQYQCHFHVDAAWGGPTLFSSTHRPLLKGIERADSVTIDAHKQLYVPMGAGMVLFKDPAALASIEHHADYILRKGSKDLGAHTLEGSRPGMAMLVHAGFHVIGRKGYELLIDQHIEKTRCFAELIAGSEDFELVAEPTLNILAYRYVPAEVQRKLKGVSLEQRQQLNDQLDEITQLLQKTQRAAGKSFVSRTRLTPSCYEGDEITVFRVVLANPLTTLETLKGVLEEQRQLAHSAGIAELLGKL